MTSYNVQSRNTTTYDGVVAPGILTYLTTDTPDFILVGENEDETLILWDSTSFSVGSRNTTTFNTTARN